MPLLRPAAATVLAFALLAGCTSSSDDGGDGGGTTGPPQPTTGPWPLTGLPGYPDDAQDPVVVVKIEDTPAGRPQVGIGSADLVVQELVEGGLTRLAAMFHSDHPDEAEPVRSMRASDVGIVLPTGGALVASGGEPSTLRAVEGAGVVTITEDAGDEGFSRDPGRVIPYNLVADVAAIADSLPPGRPPGSYLPFGALPADAVGEPASGLELRWPSSRSEFALDADGRWTRADLPDPEGFEFTTVVALSLAVRFDGSRDSSGTLIPQMVTEGRGPGLVVTGDRAFEVEWSKASPQSPWSLTYVPEADAGQSASAPQPFAIPPGRVWLALLPEEGGQWRVEAPPAESTSP